MTITFNKKDAKKSVNELQEKLKNKSDKGNLAKYFGKLKRNIDGLKYQKEMRVNEITLKVI